MERLSMRMIREVLRLKFECGLSDRKIAKSTGIARSSIGDYVRRFHDSGLVWPLSAALKDLDLDPVCFRRPLRFQPISARCRIGFGSIRSCVARV